MSFPLSLACKLISTPQAIQRPKSIPLLTTTPKLTPNTFSFPQCKPLSSSSSFSLVPNAVSPSSNKAGTTTEKPIGDEQYKLLREDILEKIKVLEGKVEELVSNPEKGQMVDKKTSVDDSGTNGTSATSQLEGVLKDSYALGQEVLGLEGKSSTQTTPTSTRQIFETILQEFNQVTSRSSDGLVSVNPNPNPGPTAEMIDQMVREMVDAYYHKEPPSLLQIEGNYAPIRKETPPTGPLPFIGQIPGDINGMYLRVGPDPVFDPEANYKWLDGDGMVHGVTIENGSASYVSRYVINSRYQQEEVFGKAKFFKYGDFEGAYGLFVAYIQMLRERLNVLDMTYGHTTSNVGVVYHAGRFMALEDFGKPFVLDITEDGDLKTVGMNNYNGNLDHNFTPHPKKDARTGEMFIVGLSHTAPYATYRVVNKDGTMRNAVPITVQAPSYLHDLAISENYVVIMDNPFIFSPEKMLTKDTWIFTFDATRKSRFGLLPRYAEDESDIKWFEFEKPFFVFHTVNAWEEDNGNKVIMYGCSLEPKLNARTGEFDISPLPFRNFTNFDTRTTTPEPDDLTLPEMYKFTFNMLTGEATKEYVPNFVNTPVDTPKINEDYMGRKCRYAYTTQFNEEALPFGFVKYDLESGHQISVGGAASGFGFTFSEPVFVPRQGATEEDDGYLICFVHIDDEELPNDFLFVLDARTMATLCWILLPSRVPYGFHSIFVSKDELDNQVKTLL